MCKSQSSFSVKWKTFLSFPQLSPFKDVCFHNRCLILGIKTGDWSSCFKKVVEVCKISDWGERLDAHRVDKCGEQNPWNSQSYWMFFFCFFFPAVPSDSGLGPPNFCKGFTGISLFILDDTAKNRPPENLKNRILTGKIQKHIMSFTIKLHQVHLQQLMIWI